MKIFTQSELAIRERVENPSRDHVTIWLRFIGCDGKPIEYGRSTEKVEIGVVSYRVPKRSCTMPR